MGTRTRDRDPDRDGGTWLGTRGRTGTELGVMEWDGIRTGTGAATGRGDRWWGQGWERGQVTGTGTGLR